MMMMRVIPNLLGHFDIRIKLMTDVQSDSLPALHSYHLSILQRKSTLQSVTLDTTSVCRFGVMGVNGGGGGINF